MMYPIILQIFIRFGALDSLSFSSSVLQSVLSVAFIGILAVWIGMTAVGITVVGMTVVGITVADGTTPVETTVGTTVGAADVIIVDVIIDDVTAVWGRLKGFFIIGVDGAASIRISLVTNQDSRPSHDQSHDRTIWLIQYESYMYLHKSSLICFNPALELILSLWFQLVETFSLVFNFKNFIKFVLLIGWQIKIISKLFENGSKLARKWFEKVKS